MRRWRQFAGHVVVIGAAVLIYFGVRGLTDSRPEIALRNAARVVHLEAVLGMGWEGTLQGLVLGSRLATALVNYVYVFGHWPVIVVSLVWLLLRHPDVFARARDTMLISGGIGLVIFASFPVAPPRLFALGLTDTVSLYSSAYRVLQPVAFTNQYAAMPSLHVGWNLVIGLALYAAAGRRVWLRLLAVAMPLAMAVSVVLTANHYLLDVAAGAVLCAVVWALRGARADRPDRAAQATEPAASADRSDHHVEPARPVHALHPG
jgi:membrane-associated phospholipid phosphatase